MPNGRAGQELLRRSQPAGRRGPPDIFTRLRRRRAVLPGCSVSAGNCCSPGHGCIVPDRNPQVCRTDSAGRHQQ